MSTFSLATTGINANSPFNPASLTLDDATGGLAGSQQNAMVFGTQIICKGPDGALKLYTVDAEHWRPGQTPRMIAVGP
jgi:hypothetical protein